MLLNHDQKDVSVEVQLLTFCFYSIQMEHSKHN